MSSAASKIYFAAKVVSTKCKENIREQPKSLSFAVLGDQQRQQCRLLLYASKNQHISLVSIGRDFEFYICEDNDLSYVDDAKDQWIVKFANFNTFVDAFRQVLLCVFFTGSEWHLAKCYRRAPSAFRSPEVGDSLRVAYSLLRCDSAGMKSCLSRDDLLELSQGSASPFEEFLLKHAQSMLTADKKLVVFDSRKVGPIPGISRQTDVMALDLHLIDIADRSDQRDSLKNRMALLGKNIFGPTDGPTDPFDDFVDSVEFSNDPAVKETRDLPPNWPQFVEESRRAFLETKLALSELSAQMSRTAPEMRSVQVQFSSDNRDRLLSTYRNHVSSQLGRISSFSSTVTSSAEMMGSRLSHLENRLSTVSSLLKSSSSAITLSHRQLRKASPRQSDNYNMDQIKKILNYTYRSVKTDLTDAVAARGFDPTTNEYLLQSLQRTIKGILSKLHSGDQ